MKVAHWVVGGIFSIVLSGCGTVKKVGDTQLGTGFSAMELCSRMFISGESQSMIVRDVIEPKTTPLPSVWHLEVDIEEKQVSVSAPFFKGVNESIAVYREGIGCTMAINRSPQQIIEQPFIPLYVAPSQRNDSPWLPGNKGEYPFDVLNMALGQMFEENSEHRHQQINTYATLIAHKGQLIAEQYDANHNAQSRMLSWSMAKTITALLAGILYDQNKLQLDEEVPMLAWQGKRATVRDLLHMSSGLDWQEEYKNASSVSNMMYLNGDMATYVSQQKEQHSPGEHFQYSTGDSQLLAELIGSKLGGQLQTIYEFYQKQFFHRLGIYNAVIEHDESGHFNGGARAYLTARDWLKVGQLIAQKGEWQGEQLISEEWIDFMTTPSKSKEYYGGHVWLGGMEAGNESLPKDAIFLRGYLGQYVAILPTEELVVVLLGAYGPTVTPTDFASTFIADVLNIQSIVADPEFAQDDTMIAGDE